MNLRCSDGTREQGAVRVVNKEVGPGTTVNHYVKPFTKCQLPLKT